MRKTETRERTVTREVVIEVKCDLCGRTAPREFNDWSEDASDVAETEVRLKSGHSYSGGGYGDTIAFDICPTCFKEKLIPWLESQGATPTRTEWFF